METITNAEFVERIRHQRANATVAERKGLQRLQEVMCPHPFCELAPPQFAMSDIMIQRYYSNDQRAAERAATDVEENLPHSRLRHAHRGQVRHQAPRTRDIALIFNDVFSNYATRNIDDLTDDEHQ